MKIIAIAGMCGSGKDITIEKFVSSSKIPVVNMGDIVRREAEMIGLAPNTETLGKIATELREDEGPSIIAERCIPIVREFMEQNPKAIIILGLRSLAEVETFKRAFGENFSLIAVHASPRVRFERLKKRGRSDDPTEWKKFEERDIRELKFGLGEVIALADYIIVNEGALIEAQKQAEEILNRIIAGNI